MVSRRNPHDRRGFSLGDADPTVPASVSERLAAAHPHLVQLAVFPKAAHVEAWNTDRARFEALVTSFLQQFSTS